MPRSNQALLTKISALVPLSKHYSSRFLTKTPSLQLFSTCAIKLITYTSQVTTGCNRQPIAALIFREWTRAQKWGLYLVQRQPCERCFLLCWHFLRFWILPHLLALPCGQKKHCGGVFLLTIRTSLFSFSMKNSSHDCICPKEILTWTVVKPGWQKNYYKLKRNKWRNEILNFTGNQTRHHSFKLAVFQLLAEKGTPN